MIEPISQIADSKLQDYGLRIVPYFILFDAVLERVCTDGFEHKIDSVAAEIFKRSKKRRQDNNLRATIFDKIFMWFTIIIIILIVSCWVLDEVFEFMSTLGIFFRFVPIASFMWILVYSLLKISFLIVLETISVLRAIIKFIRTIKRKGMKPTLYRYLKLFFKKIKNWLKNYKNEEKLSLRDSSDFFSFTFSLFKWVVCFTKNVLQKGFFPTIQECTIQATQKITDVIKYINENETPVYYNESQIHGLDSKNMMNLAFKLSKIFIVLKNIWVNWVCLHFFIWLTHGMIVKLLEEQYVFSQEYWIGTH